MSESFKQFEWPEDYYIWLCDMIDLETHSGYSDLISFLYDAKYTWSVPKDGNRAQDGKNLRRDYIYEYYYDEGAWMDDPCSWLEMFIALARRVRIDLMPDYDLEIEDWFWQFLELWGLKKWQESGEKVAKTAKNCQKLGQKFENSGKNLPNSQLFDREIWTEIQSWLAKKYDF